jgi:phosphatidylserine/phosphatidylglycerophosphate/cardiolipin synthase-like enzyme
MAFNQGVVMRFKSNETDGVQVFAVAGTNVVSFGISASRTARNGLLGFSIRRVDTATGDEFKVLGYKVFRSLIPKPTPKTKVDTWDHPVQSLVWDDFYAQPGRTYEYRFYPFRGTPADPDHSAEPVSVTVTTEPLSGGDHDIFFNRGVTGSQSYAIRFGNTPPDKQPTPAKRAQAYQWLSRNLDEALINIIESAQPGDALRGCFYEFTFARALSAFKKALDRGVDVQLIVDEKDNEHTINPTKKNKLKKPKLVASMPREENLAAIKKARLPKTAIIARCARRDDIQHNKFIVLLRGPRKRPVEVWTGSTNLTDGGIYGQANVGHHVRDPKTAKAFFEYWKLLADDPGAPTDAKMDPANVAFLGAVEALSPVPASIDDIRVGVTPVFSPRPGLEPLTLYSHLLADAKTLSCGTFPFGITRSWREPLAAPGKKGRLCFLLLDKVDSTKPTKSDPGPVIALNSSSNIYKAYGSELDTPLGQWVAETNNIKLELNQFVSYIHLKFILSDPLGDDPIIVTGSANFSSASTCENDENMMLIRGDRRVADIYYTEFNRLWGHYYFRSVVDRTKRELKTTTANRAKATRGRQFLSERAADWLADYQAGDLRTKRVNQYLTMTI